MKQNKLIKLLKKLDAKLIRQGASHEIWESKTGRRFPVPRHGEINEMTAKSILKQAS